LAQSIYASQMMTMDMTSATIKSDFGTMQDFDIEGNA
jgi:hypothetical protein